MEVTKNVYCAKGVCTVDQSIVTGLQEAQWSVRLKIVDSEAMLQTVVANLVSSTQIVSGE